MVVAAKKCLISKWHITSIILDETSTITTNIIVLHWEESNLADAEVNTAARHKALKTFE